MIGVTRRRSILPFLALNFYRCDFKTKQKLRVEYTIYLGLFIESSERGGFESLRFHENENDQRANIIQVILKDPVLNLLISP